MIKVVVMGVSGCGKSFIGSALAAELGLPFLEGDALHPLANVQKMAAGIPLTDDDRWPWLDRIGAEIAASATGMVVSCSGLRRAYRDRLRVASDGPLAFLFLDGAYATLYARVSSRPLHFMPASLLDSQLDTLESPIGEPLVLTQAIEQSAAQIVAASAAWLRGLDPAFPGR